MNSDTKTQDVFELVLARPAIVESGDHGSLAHLWWRAPHQGNRLVQVYVDGVLCDVSYCPKQRDMWLMLNREFLHRIELLAVSYDDEDVLEPDPRALAGWDPVLTDVAEVSIVRDETLPIDTAIAVEMDEQVVDRGLLWPTNVNRSGFGALFGLGSFGSDDVAGPGVGEGELGSGPLGSDGYAWRWRRGDLAEGEHDMVFNAEDSNGLRVADPIERNSIVIERLPAPVSSLSISKESKLTWAD